MKKGDGILYGPSSPTSSGSHSSISVDELNLSPVLNHSALAASVGSESPYFYALTADSMPDSTLDERTQLTSALLQAHADHDSHEQDIASYHQQILDLQEKIREAEMKREAALKKRLRVEKALKALDKRESGSLNIATLDDGQIDRVMMGRSHTGDSSISSDDTGSGRTDSTSSSPASSPRSLSHLEMQRQRDALSGQASPRTAQSILQAIQSGNNSAKLGAGGRGSPGS